MKLGYVILYVPDVLGSVTFYEKAFGLVRRFMHDSGQYAEMNTGATALAFAGEDTISTAGQGFRRNRPEEPAAAAEVALVTDDVLNGFNRAIEAGAVPVLHPTEKPWGQVISYVRDNNGFLVEICSEVVS
jgi:catechol 2,3-dioxygenase-like lactoylglutathione lyase family enzyme